MGEAATSLAFRFAAQIEAELAEFPSDWPEVEYLFLNAYIGDRRNHMTAGPRPDTITQL